MPRLQHRILVLASLCTVTLLASCASDKSPGSLRSDPLRPGAVDDLRASRLPAGQLYVSAREALDSSDYSTALALYDRLDAQFPFTRYATQGKLEAIYAHYRAYQPELALSAADRFMRANPRHEHLDYVLYLRGLINFDRGASDILDALDIDSTTRDPINARRAFEDFGRLLQRFPTSLYAPDARQRMVYLRERIARHEMAIARFYEGRGAWVAASRRAQDIISKFQGSAVMPEALDLLARCYEELKMPGRAAEVRAVKLASFGAENTTPAPQPSSEPEATAPEAAPAATAPAETPPPLRPPESRLPEESAADAKPETEQPRRGPARRR